MAKSKEVDRISALSNALLSLILSFLSMKDVVKTSILCRRWKYIWTKVPILDFSTLNVPHSLLPSFKVFVYKALLLNDAPLLRRFSMDHLNEIEDFHVNSWVWSVMYRNVVKISLGPFGSSVFKRIRLVGAAFSSQTLQELWLNGFILPSVVPSVQHFPNLELLHMVDVAFEQNDTLPVLLSVCPRLKQLLLHYCVAPNVMHIQSSSLRKLVIFSTAVEEEVVLNAPKLEYISLENYFSCCEIKAVQPLTCLVEAIYIGTWKENGLRIIDLLHQSSKLKTLKLTQSLVKHSLKYAEAKLPVFANLSLLEVVCGSGPFVLQMLKNALNLTSLILYKLDCMEDSWGPVDYFLMLPESAPKCLSRSLRYVEMNNFCGYGSHLKLAEYILTYAEVLKVMKIYTANEDWDNEMNGLMQLFLINRASTHCEFTLGIP